MSEIGTGTLQELIRVRVVLISRGFGVEALLKVGEILLEEGIRSIEVTMDSPDAQRSIRELCREFSGSLVVGAGTILDADDARKAIDAGAAFLVSPADVVEVIPMCKEADVVSIIGATTPSEILRVTRSGADFVKLFPATVFGPAYVRDVLGPMPFAKFYVSGGLTADSAPAFFKAGASLIGIGGEVLNRSEVTAGDWASISRRARLVAQSMGGE